MHGANGLKNSAIGGNIGHFDNAVHRMQTMHSANGSQKMPTKNGLTMPTKNGLTMPTKNGLPMLTRRLELLSILSLAAALGRLRRDRRDP